MSRPLVIAIVGGIASGKSYVCEIFASKGFVTISADDVAHDIIDLENVKEKIVAICGNDILCNSTASIAETSIDRDKLSDMAFYDVEKLAILESIIHPLTFTKIEQEIKQNHEMGRHVVVEMPLFYELSTPDALSFRSLCDICITTSIDVDTQKLRALQTRDMSAEKFDIIANRQYSNSDRVSMADVVIDTSKDKEIVIKTINKIIDDINNL